MKKETLPAPSILKKLISFDPRAGQGIMGDAKAIQKARHERASMEIDRRRAAAVKARGHSTGGGAFREGMASLFDLGYLFGFTAGGHVAGAARVSADDDARQSAVAVKHEVASALGGGNDWECVGNDMRVAIVLYMFRHGITADAIGLTRAERADLDSFPADAYYAICPQLRDRTPAPSP